MNLACSIVVIFSVVIILFIFLMDITHIYKYKKRKTVYTVCNGMLTKIIVFLSAVYFDTSWLVASFTDTSDVQFLLLSIFLNIFFVGIQLFFVRKKIIVENKTIKIIYAFRKSKVVELNCIKEVIVKDFNIYKLVKKIKAYDATYKVLFSFLSTDRNGKRFLELLKQQVLISDKNELL